MGQRNPNLALDYLCIEKGLILIQVFSMISWLIHDGSERE
jgi:hypothetical protein